MPKEKLNHDPFLAWLATVAVAGSLGGCGGGDKEPPGGAGTSSAGPGGAATGGDVRDGAEASIKLFALGGSIFHGQVGGGRWAELR
jgi:hypothetical protein